MALSIKTEEADQLARALSQLTGESLTQVVTTALRERLEREHARRQPDLAAHVAAFARRLRPHYDTRPVTRREWDAASGDEC